jgi:lysophospholipid acyltransferase (LPLAT)-like uncharacterized protein
MRSYPDGFSDGRQFSDIPDQHGMGTVKLRNRTLIRTIARTLVFVFRCLFLTLRKRILPAVPGFSPHSEPDDEHRSIFCVWHDAILGAIFCGQTNNVAALVSQNYDGTVIADTLDAVGIQPIRGSSSRGGAVAVRQMFSLADRKHLVIATDGPRGPRRQVKDGIIYLASQSGRPIVPVAVSSSWAWRPKGRWTDMLIPLPFGRFYVLGGTPIRVPQNLTTQELGPYRDLVQQAMDDLQVVAERIATGACTEWPVTRENQASNESTRQARAA